MPFDESLAGLPFLKPTKLRRYRKVENEDGFTESLDATFPLFGTDGYAGSRFSKPFALRNQGRSRRRKYLGIVGFLARIA